MDLETRSKLGMETKKIKKTGFRPQTYIMVRKMVSLAYPK